ncbi:unnamed protein product [Rhizophagus irregularis]|uniref:Sacsin/Nov domain-containing protein n=1 Tax=Rhizophagus irregularis TaxID=588596 RepID=A0A915ZU07_9GLOM|nr:unnamed protein product [Rhizophagus irregularis]
MFLDAFRDNILSNSEGELVEINQRCLIDKILARYSSEFVIYRELMQNSDDAKSSSIQIIFETKNNVVTRILFKNNGIYFRPEDWNRLKKIAEGNPDEQKIGAFGVGFYSLFSVCDNPFVFSGGQGMAFYWRGNQLFTKQGQNKSTDDWTTFLMDMKDPTEGFTENLQNISVLFNDTLVIRLSKKIQRPEPLRITSEFNTYSPQRMFQLTSINVGRVQLDVERLIVPTNFNVRQLHLINYQTEKASIFLKTANGDLDVRVSNEFSLKMEQITKKKPPRKTSIQMIFTGFNEHNLSSDSDENISPVFKDLLQYPEQGKIYIGFSTDQTTGCCSHLAARVIPTMERVSIDMANETLAKYNSELLYLSGTLCRILYEDEMDQIKRSYNSVNAVHDRALLEKRAAHALTHFTYHPSTPNTQIGKILESQFFDCTRKNLSILSTNGVLPISDVRIPDPKMKGFIKNVPVVPTNIFERCNIFFIKAKNTLNLIRDLNFQDVLHELRNRMFSENEITELLKWFVSYRSSGNIVSASELDQFMGLTRIGNIFRTLKTIRHYLNPGIIPTDMDVPNDVMPYTISKTLPPQDLKKWFGWSELTLVIWAKFIVNKPNLENDLTFARKVLQILARNLNNTSRNNKEIIRQLFFQKRCIPTKFGLKLPNEAYFQNVTIFPDLPTIEFQKPLSVQSLMELLGVRKVVELKLVFDRLDRGNWDHMQLVKYLASMSSDLKADEIRILKSKPIWPKEDSAGSQLVQIQRFVTSNLHVPSSLNREFGLPIIDWKGRWSSSTQEGTFLIMLGLREYPTLKTILELAAPPTDPKIRSKAFEYFIDNFDKNYLKEYSPATVNNAFLPCSDQNTYAKPSECFINLECKIMKFKVIRQDLRYRVEKLGVHQDPSRETIINELKKLSRYVQYGDDAKKIFEYLASRKKDFIRSDFDQLAKFDFIPLRNKTKINEIILFNPRSVYFEVQEGLSEFFPCIDFGERANSFLSACGVKKRPSPVDLARLLVESSAKLWGLIKGNIEKYLNILRIIAIDFKSCRNIADEPSLIARMKGAPILVAIKKERQERRTNSGDGNNDGIDCYYLSSTNKIFINDNKIYQRVFNPLTAPEENLLESLYKELGCRSLQDSVKETSTPRGIKETNKSKQLQNEIMERSSLFYHEYKEHDIKRDEKWLEKLKVREVDYIETIYVLENDEKKERTDTLILQVAGMDSWTLYISSSSNLLDVSKHIVKNIYKVSNWKDVGYFNMLLTSPLLVLKEMGYPVDRILQQRKLQNIADQLENEVKSDNNGTSANHNHDNYNNFNSLFSNNNNNSRPRQSRGTNSVHDYNFGSIFNGISKNKNTNYEKDKKSFILNLKPNNKSVNITTTTTNKTPTITSETTQILQNQLQNAVEACRSNAGVIINQKRSTEIVNVNEESQINHCEVIPVYSLSHIKTIQEIKFYLPKIRSMFPQLYDEASLNRFVNLLRDLASVFGLSTATIHIFYDENASSIAFNNNGELFFNLKVYTILHDEECKIKPTIYAMAYWFMTLCHELAHNIILSHNSGHEYYFSSFAEIYMSNFLALIESRGIAFKYNNVQQNFGQISFNKFGWY